MTTSDDHYTAAGGVVVDGDRVLILHRPGRSEVRLPKGHVMPDEELSDAALREVEEESGYRNLHVRCDLGKQVVFFVRQGQRVVRDEIFFLMTPQDGGLGSLRSVRGAIPARLGFVGRCPAVADI